MWRPLPDAPPRRSCGEGAGGCAAADPLALADAGPADLAWEWLRRNPAYRAEASRWLGLAQPVTDLPTAPLNLIEALGCLTLPDPCLGWQDASILWSSELDSTVLPLAALPMSASIGLGFDLAAWPGRAAISRGPDAEHVRLDDDAGTIRMDLVTGTLLGGPVRLVLDPAALRTAAPIAGPLGRLLGTNCIPIPSTSVRLTRQQHRRQVQALQVHDARALGASIRDIGILLFGEDRVQADWASEALKSNCRRLIALAKAMATGGHRALFD
ncbi:DNA -binding domain-containing protein [Sphingomonas sp. CJ99]